MYCEGKILPVGLSRAGDACSLDGKQNNMQDYTLPLCLARILATSECVSSASFRDHSTVSRIHMHNATRFFSLLYASYSRSYINRAGGVNVLLFFFSCRRSLSFSLSPPVPFPNKNALLFLLFRQHTLSLLPRAFSPSPRGATTSRPISSSPRERVRSGCPRGWGALPLAEAWRAKAWYLLVLASSSQLPTCSYCCCCCCGVSCVFIRSVCVFVSALRTESLRGRS